MLFKDVAIRHQVRDLARQRRPRKVHAGDTGLRNAVGLTGSPDRGRLAETAVANALAAEAGDDLYYWQGKGEVDLLVRRGTAARALVQVVYEGLEDPDVRERELAALAEAQARFPRADATLVVGRAAEVEPAPESSGVRLVPLWRFLLGER